MQIFRSSLIAASRRSVVVAAPSRAFSVSPRFHKDATDTIKETAEVVNKKVGEGLLKGVIEPSEKAAEAVKSAIGVGQQKAAEATQDIRGKAAEATEDVRAKAAEATQDLQGAASSATENAKQAGLNAGEDLKASATNAGYTAEQVKLEGQKKLNNAATEAERATK